MELKETGEAIGCIGYYDHAESNIQIGEKDAEIGYWIGKPYWNQGLGTEALRWGWSTGVSTKWASSHSGATTSLTTPLPDGLWRNAASGTLARIRLLFVRGRSLFTIETFGICAKKMYLCSLNYAASLRL